MRLADRFTTEGRQLFARRSVVPLVLLPVVLLAMPESRRVEAQLGAPWALAIQWLALAVAFAGVAVRCAAVGFAPDGTSSRDTHRLRAPSLNSTGMYSIVRHPLYLGSALIWLGAAMSLRVWWLVVIVGLVYWLYIERVMLVEEQFLRQTFRAAFDDWVDRTPAFVPRWSQWTSPSGPFLWKRVLGEHNGLLGIAVVMPLLEFLADQQDGGESLTRWSHDHFDLVTLLAAGVLISSLSLVLRRRLAERATDSAVA